MIKVQIPDNNLSEREYIIKIILSNFLGLQYSLTTSHLESHCSILFGESELIVNDSFFNLYKEPLSYLCVDALPDKIIYVKNEFTVEKNIPVIFGTDELQIVGNKIICGIDIFASSFFMLTRWEEMINSLRDTHLRFPGIQSIAYQNDFLHRPVVNEYVEMLWKMMQRLGYQGERKKRNFELALTHDVDALTYVSNRSIVGDILKRKPIKLVKEHLNYLLFQDPYDTFDFLMTVSERLGLKSHFYFMSSNSKQMYDTGYYLNRRKFDSTIKEIKKRGHIIGFHPGYYTFNDYDRWNYEKQLLMETINQDIVEGRQHYLRMDVTKTLAICNKNNMEIDSTLSYADKEGFRCGTGDLFPVFDFLRREQLQLKERPLILMDGTLRQYQKYSLDKARDIIQYYISLGQRYKTTITFLFHNSSFFGEWAGYDSIYKDVLNIYQ
jgi:hypothetical protein